MTEGPVGATTAQAAKAQIPPKIAATPHSFGSRSITPSSFFRLDVQL
ncbi:MAG TPA: hypothetical protein VIY90_10200 [Steroidobacteraceae bacterium]